MINKTVEAPPPEEWLTPLQVARLLGKKSPSVVYALHAAGLLAGDYPTPGGGLRIARSEYDRYSAAVRERAQADAERRRRALSGAA